MIAVSDTGPMRYLILMEEIQLLEAIFGLIAIPAAVVNELTQPSSRALVRSWMQRRPKWLEIRFATTQTFAFPPKLGHGERDAIALAQELAADTLLVDDLAARVEANARGIPVVGTLGILDLAVEHGLADFHTSLEKLRATNFRASGKLIQFFLERDRARKRSS